ncbi:COP9 signalosome complex subunit 1-like [Silene latifolia]|uniref:COP9 signalosome complex subunit 1-like n=1 Tax=Silene latifolia TaxID=37657 RepID=UPI003D76DD9B
MENDNDNSNSTHMMDEIYTNGDNDNDKTQRQSPIISSEQLDIESYASFYTGRTKIMRLIFIADRCDNPSMQLEALLMAFDEVKKGEDSYLFMEVARRIDGRLETDNGMDREWLVGIHRRAQLRGQKLEYELNVSKSKLINESIRMGYNDFGDFFYARGQLADALKSYDRTSNYCTTAKHKVNMCLNAILVSIEMGQFSQIDKYVSKAEETPEALEPIVLAKLHCAAGLANLGAKKYKLAARKFVEVIPELRNNYSEVIAPQDVATYGGLCALATFDRSELKSKVIDNLNFRNYLELVPEIRELIHDFYSSQYASCLDYLGNLKTNLLLDIRLHDHVEGLYKEIRNKALIQYTLPFISVDLNMMANAFKTSVSELQKELETLITNNQIQARIDSRDKIVYARHLDQRNATFQRVLQTGAGIDRDVTSMLLRANIMKYDYKHPMRI